MASTSFELQTQRLGPLPLANHFLKQLGIDRLLEKHVPTDDRRVTLPYAKGLGVLLRSIIVEREPVYRQQETVEGFAASMFGVDDGEVAKLTDDRIGRALDRLFDADRAALLTDVVVAAHKQFELSFEELHNDSTTIRFCGQYREARGRRVRGRRAPWITYGHSKDERPDLKQLLFILTTTTDGGVPVQFRTADGNTNDTRTHIETWDALRRVAGRNDFLYVGDSKLCTRDNMNYIDQHGGRFVTVLPRSRLEDREFREWIQTHEPKWESVWDRPNPRRKYGPRDRWWVFLAPLPSREAWPVVWVYSSLLALHQEETRREHLAAAVEDLEELKAKLAKPRSRIKKPAEVEERIQKILARRQVVRYLAVERVTHEEHEFRKTRPGRAGANSTYRRITRRRHDIVWRLDEAAIAYDRKSDGMYPLLTNHRGLTPRQVLEAHKRQPTIEKRFQQLKSVHAIAPVCLKNEDRIEALFTLYFLGLTVQGLIERELRRAMNREGLRELPIYPEARACTHPTTEQVLRLFSLAQRHVLLCGGRPVQTFEVELTELQKQVLKLLGVSSRAYTRSS
jgi:transposase